MSDISVVIPTKDRLRYLQKALPMFLEYEQVGEVIIVVDGCGDGTLEYVKDAAVRDERIIYTDNIVNRGLPYSRNRGIELAKFPYVFTGEDDLELVGDFFGTLLSHMQETGADVISGRNIFKFETESATEAIGRTAGITGDAVNSRAISVHTGIAVSGDQEQLLLPAPMLCSIDVFRKIQFDDSYRGNAWREESDFQLSAHSLGYKLVYCPHAIGFNVMIENDRGGVHASGEMKRLICIVRNNWRFIRKHQALIAREFDAGNHFLYITKFTVKRATAEILVPRLIRTKRILLAALHGN